MVDKGCLAHCVDSRERFRGVERTRVLKDIIAEVMV